MKTMNKVKKNLNQQGKINIGYNNKGCEMLNDQLQIPIVCSVGACGPT